MKRMFLRDNSKEGDGDEPMPVGQQGDAEGDGGMGIGPVILWGKSGFLKV